MKAKSVTPKDLPMIRVTVLEHGQRASANSLPCLIGQNLDFTTSRLESYCLASWKPLVFDALLVAAAIEFCDRIKKRPSMGWGRHFEVQIPVHDVAHWSSKALLYALTDALEFLTGDRWRIHFYKRYRPEQRQQQAHLPIPPGITTIIPFSDGMDSRAVSALLAKELGSRLCRVRLGSKITDRRTSARQRQPFTTVPYEVSTGRGSGETSARSRGFKFATVSAVAAYLVGAKEIIVSESGQGALGPALVAAGQAYEDYRNHPLFTDRMERYLNAAFGMDIRFRFPRLWKTKGETLAEYAKLTNETAHIDARSCWQQSRQVSVNGHRRQCGVCASCMLRRLSVYAAGLKEPRETYVWENLGAPTIEAGAANGFNKITGALREYAIAGALHLDHLADLRGSPLHKGALRRHARQLAHSQALSLDDAEANLDRLLAQHSKEWREFIHSLGRKSFITNWVASAA